MSEQYDPERDVRLFRAVRAYIADRDAALHAKGDFIDLLQDEFIEDAERLHLIRGGFNKLLLRLQRRPISDAKADAILTAIAEVGADTARFCKYLGVDGIAQITVDRFDDAMAALARKGQQAAVPQAPAERELAAA